jgi:hypothetical protein
MLIWSFTTSQHPHCCMHVTSYTWALHFRLPLRPTGWMDRTLCLPACLLACLLAGGHKLWYIVHIHVIPYAGSSRWGEPSQREQGAFPVPSCWDAGCCFEWSRCDVVYAGLLYCAKGSSVPPVHRRLRRHSNHTLGFVVCESRADDTCTIDKSPTSESHWDSPKRIYGCVP